MADAFEFPDEIEAKGKPSESASDDDFEVVVVDDTPERDRGRAPLNREVADPTDDEIESYSDKVKNRIKELTHARHDERRVKEATMREKQELENFAQRLLNENQQLKGFVDNGSQQYAGVVKHVAEEELVKARRQYKEAQEAYDTDAILGWNRQEIFAQSLYKRTVTWYKRINRHPNRCNRTIKLCAGRQKTSGSVKTGTKN